MPWLSSPIRLADHRRKPTAAAILAVLAATTLAGCSSVAAPSAGQAQTYAGKANLAARDLPAGWKSSGAPDTSVTRSTLPRSQAKTVTAVLGGLPPSCRSLDAVFTTALLGAAPPGAVAQDQADFHSTTEGAEIASTVAVLGSTSGSWAIVASYASPAFVPCLQAFLGGTLTRVFDVSSAAVSVVRSSVPQPPAGVVATAFSISQSGIQSGSRPSVSSSEEVVLQSGKALGFLEAGSPTSALPAGTADALDQAASAVAHRLLSPPK